MKVDIYISEKGGDRTIRIPWLPEKIDFKSGGTIRATYDIMDKGPVEVLTGSGLWEFSWKSTFPGEKQVNNVMQRGEWQYPLTYHNIFEEWKRNKTLLWLRVTGYPINKDVMLDDYKGSAIGAFGDIEYEVSFIESRNITIKTTKASQEELASTAQIKRTVEQPKTYTVVEGDTLWDISESQYSIGARYQEIYDANKEIIERQAKQMGKSSSNNGWWIYPDTTLTIPK